MKSSNKNVANAMRTCNAVGADGKPIKIGDKVEWIDNGFHKGIVTLVDYNRIVVDGKHNVDAMDIYHEGRHPFKNSRALNDQWIDDFHVIVTSGKPDASLLSALKDKATAWKLSKKNFSDRTAADRHNAAESKVYDIARRLGAKVIQQGAVMKVVMPNSRARNAKFKVGDKVKLISTGQVGTISRVTTNFGFTSYWVKGLPGGPNDAPVYAEHLLTLANSRACNALKLEPFNPNSVRLGKSVWYKGREMTYKGKSGGNVHLVDLGGNRIDVPVFDRNLKMLADAYEYYHNDGVPMPNSRVCNSTNPIVRKAMNAVWRNANPKITGKGPISMDDDIVAVYKPDGKLEWRGYFDDCTYRYDKMKYDPSTKTYRVDGPGGDYRILALNNSRAYNSSNLVVRKAINAAACNSSIDDALAEAERNKYDSVVLFQKVIGSGTLFPDKFKLDGGYDCEDAVRAAVKTGKYNEAIFYKNGAIKKRIGLN